MKKILTIGDIHGKDIWKKLTMDTYDKVIFMGDYVDAFDKSDDEMINNLLDIVEFKKNNREDVVLLIGNHDLNYYPKFGYERYGSSGYRHRIAGALKKIYSDYERLFEYAYQITDDTRNYLWTHAGVTNKWYNSVFIPDFESEAILEENLTVADQLNIMFYNRYDCLTQVGWERGGYSKYGSPLWADKAEFTSRGIPLRGFHQIVGHNPVPDITIHTIDNDTEIVFTDCLDKQEKGYVLPILISQF